MYFIYSAIDSRVFRPVVKRIFGFLWDLFCNITTANGLNSVIGALVSNLHVQINEQSHFLARNGTIVM